VAGFKVNALVSLSPNASWSRLASEFLAAKDDQALLMPFVNTVLCEGWQAAGMVDEGALSSRVEPIGMDRIPREVLSLHLGADLQDDRVEPTILGRARNGDLYVLQHQPIWGSFQDPATWREVDDVLNTKWRHPSGGHIGIDSAIFDCGDGDHFPVVTGFCLPRRGRYIFAGKGVGGSRPIFEMTRSKTQSNRFGLVGVDVAKTMLFDRMARGQGIHFSESLERRYFEEVASQKRVIKYTRGMPTRRFEMVSGRARKECLDALMLAFAASDNRCRPINYDQRERELRGIFAPKRPTRSVSEMLA
jgi:phage terminase large subunit GpA-like protein